MYWQLGFPEAQCQSSITMIRKYIVHVETARVFAMQIMNCINAKQKRSKCVERERGAQVIGKGQSRHWH